MEGKGSERMTSKIKTEKGWEERKEREESEEKEKGG